MNKKDFPLVVLECLEEFTSLQSKNFKAVEPGENLLKIVDVDPDSKFFFVIERHEINSNNILILTVNYSPKNANEVTAYKFRMAQSELKKRFEDWVKLLQRYEKVKSFYDDPIVETYAEEYYAKFEIIDDDYGKPLSVDNVRILDKHLANIEDHIEEYKTEENSAAIEDIKESAGKIRDLLTQESRAEILKQLSVLWGKLTKYIGLKVDVFITESVKLLAKAAVQTLIEIA